MKYSNFEKNFLITSESQDSPSTSEATLSEPFIADFIHQYGGKSFNEGLYRVLNHSQIGYWNKLATRAFPAFVGKITCFGIDWLGRVFAQDSTRLVNSQFAIVMLEPGTAQALEIPCEIQGFHEVELQEYRDAALAESFFKKWLGNGGQRPNINQCIAYKRPLFLGGKDVIENLAVSDLDVYWEISVQLIEKVRRGR